jgi:two-component system response regulator
MTEGMEPAHLPVLITEDSADDYEAILRAFEEAGLRLPTLWCRTGDEAIGFLKHLKKNGMKREEQPCFILLDLNLPGMDGREVLEYIKGDEKLKVIPVIIFTTSSNDRDIERCYAGGANAYMQKPIDFRALVKVVRSLKEYWVDTALLPTSEPAPGDDKY